MIYAQPQCQTYSMCSWMYHLFAFTVETIILHLQDHPQTLLTLLNDHTLPE